MTNNIMIIIAFALYLGLMMYIGVYYYRKSNSHCQRYRKSPHEIAAVAAALAESGVHLIDLTMGEDPQYLSNSRLGYRQLI